jgi:hypothetical protein
VLGQPSSLNSTNCTVKQTLAVIGRSFGASRSWIAPVAAATAASSSAPSRPSLSTASASPSATQVIQVTRKRTIGGSHASTGRRRWQTVTVYAITGLGFAQASPARLADLPRGYRAIEALHHLRDGTFYEDTSQLRTGASPHVMATLRNLVIGVVDPWPPSGSASDETVITTERRSPGRRRRSQPASRHRAYGANPLSIQVRKRWTLSAGHGP